MRLTFRAFASGFAVVLWMSPLAVRADDLTAGESKELEACGAGTIEATFACTSRVMDAHLLREATEKSLTSEDRKAITREIERTQQLALEGIAESLHFHIATQENHLENMQRVLDLSTGTVGEAPVCPSGCYPGNIHKCVCGGR